MAARVRGRDATVAALARPGGAVEETGAVEVLRLVLTDGGKLELRVFGGRIELGALTT